MSKVTTHKSEKAGVYRVSVDGRDTGLTIEKAEAAKFGMAQEWDVLHSADDAYLFSAKGKAGAIAVIQAILDACNMGK